MMPKEVDLLREAVLCTSKFSCPFSFKSIMSGHGPDAESYEKGISDSGTPVKFNGGLAFMFETTFILSLTQWAMTKEA